MYMRCTYICKLQIIWLSIVKKTSEDNCLGVTVAVFATTVPDSLGSIPMLDQMYIRAANICFEVWVFSVFNMYL